MGVKKVVVAISGASGAIYGIRLLKALLARPISVSLIVSPAGRLVLSHEAGYDGGPVADFLQSRGVFFHPEAVLAVHDSDDLFAPPASGSFRHQGMVIAPCAMRTLGGIAAGIADNLILRAADVCLKEKRTLILLARETPLSAIHLENMHRLALAGAVIMPPVPGFYTMPETIEALVDTTVARVLDHLGIEHDLVAPWGEAQ